MSAIGKIIGFDLAARLSKVAEELGVSQASLIREGVEIVLEVREKEVADE